MPKSKRKWCRACRRVKCRCELPKEIWVCFDVANGDGIEVHPDSKHYVWWFGSRRQAMRQMEDHRKNRSYAILSGPFKYVREKK